MKIAVIDLETTGLDSVHDRIIEVGVVLLDNFRIVSSFSRFVNCGTPIPDEISTLTGINTSDIISAKEFRELAPALDRLTKDFIIAGHRVEFDYSFLKQEMKRAGINFSRETVCTAELMKMLFPGRKSYSLKSVCRYFEVENERPHRAFSDAMATAKVLVRQVRLLGDENFRRYSIRPVHKKLPQVIKHAMSSLPSNPGIYYFIGKNRKPLYIGKARNIRKRVSSHFKSDNKGFRTFEKVEEIREIRYEVTGDELLASLLEDHEIRRFWPALNQAQKNHNKKFGVVVYRDMNNNWRMAVSSSSKSWLFIAYFHQYFKAVEFIRRQVQDFNLSATLCGLPGNEEELHRKHNSNFESMLDRHASESKVDIYFTHGRSDEESGFVWIENDRYAGFGFIDKKTIPTLGNLRKSLKEYLTSITVESIIDKYIKTNQPSITFNHHKKTPPEIAGGVFLQS